MEANVAFVAATVLGVVVLYVTIRSTCSAFVVQLFPALGTAIVVGAAFYPVRTPGKSLKPFDRPLRKPSTREQLDHPRHGICRRRADVLHRTDKPDR